jgi:hypothetical protein
MNAKHNNKRNDNERDSCSHVKTQLRFYSDRRHAEAIMSPAIDISGAEGGWKRKKETIFSFSRFFLFYFPFPLNCFEILEIFDVADELFDGCSSLCDSDGISVDFNHLMLPEVLETLRHPIS